MPKENYVILKDVIGNNTVHIMKDDVLEQYKFQQNFEKKN